MEVTLLHSMVILSVIYLGFITPANSKIGKKSKIVKVGVNKGFRGGYHTIKLSDKCNNIPVAVNDLVSSIDPQGQCIEIFKDSRCRGPSLEIRGVPVYDLNIIHFNDQVSSLKLCGTFSFRKSKSWKYLLRKILLRNEEILRQLKQDEATLDIDHDISDESISNSI